jgi:hypothetical protein
MLVRIAILLLFATPSALAGDPTSIGMWEGESLCTVPDSPCHDEHVVYEIKADEKDQAKLTLDAFKIVSGEKQFMGTLNCAWRNTESILACHYRDDDDWSFKLSGNEMNGTLHIRKERQLYRKISATKK